jgi:four helix bundle protein
VFSTFSTSIATINYIMVQINTYKDLLIWQKSITLVREVYSSLESFPKEEKFGLCKQMGSSAISIPSNIAEGYGRHSTKEYKRFLLIATGSLFELQTQIEISFQLGHIDKIKANELMQLTEEIDRMMSSLIRKLI